MDANKIELNPSQQAAVDFPHEQPAIVTAAAGSGKTTLLVQRVIRLLSDVSLDIPADSLAIMTFTKNATKNMREKLNRELNNALNALADSASEEDRRQYDYLKKQVFLLRQAAISTIDAFCLRIIKENAEAFDLPLNFTIADDTKKAAMQSQAMKSAMEEFYSEAFSDSERNILFFSFSFEDDKTLEKTLLSVTEKLSSFPNPDKWINDSINAYSDIRSVEKHFLELLDNGLELNIRRAERTVGRYSSENICGNLRGEVAAETKTTDALKKMRTTILPAIEQYITFDEKRVKELRNGFEAYKKNRSIKSLEKLLNELEDSMEKAPDRHSRSGNKYDGKKRFNAIAKDVEETVKTLVSSRIDYEAEKNDLASMQNALKSFFKLLKIYMDCYELEKHAAGCIDFSDSERKLYNKLAENGGDNDFRRQLSQRFRCIIVDEFQDSNDIQAEIFRLLGDGRLFYVGDVKQSIYAFRGADPYIMAALCEEGSAFTKLPLNTNYRSRKAVIDTVNAAFNGLMTVKYGGVDYADNNGLNLGLDLPEPQNKTLYDSEVMLVAAPKSNDDEGDDKDMTLPRSVANKIKELHDDPNFLIADGKDSSGGFKYKRAEYSDFIVLLRTKKKIECYRKALAEIGIPSAAPKGSNFFKADEIVLAHNYLKIIDDPLLNEEMLKVLMSPIYRFTAEETAQLKMGVLGLEDLGEIELHAVANSYRRRSLYNCVSDCMTQTARRGKEKIQVKRTISPKLERFFGDLKAFRYFMSSGSLVDLVRKVYEDTDLISVVAAFEDSAGRVENIRRLQKLAADFEARGGGGLGDFLRFLERAAENVKNGVEEAARPESGANSVRIKTFHGSKGLEAPVCIMTELQYVMRHGDYTGDVLVNLKHPMAMAHTDIIHRRKSKMLAHQAVGSFIRERQLGDELRLLYVAMTRAQEKLIMVSSVTANQYNGFSEYVSGNRLDPEFHDEVYDTSTPFKCVMKSLLQYAPSIGENDKAFRLTDIDCKFTAVSGANPPANEQTAADDVSENSVSSSEAAELSALMKLEYGHLEDTAQQAKFTTTELAHKKSAKPISLTKPLFASGGKISGVEKGNAYHHCMQHFPIDSVNAEMTLDELIKSVTSTLDKMTERKKITQDERGIVEAERIA
ncbi:MAG: UvrD-helicase domain-containing protein, partial [Oscillospiraceae bacterium]|nr:UvrD-helicase domain-containing protein [Oscillospiraceae bacterium]